MRTQHHPVPLMFAALILGACGQPPNHTALPDSPTPHGGARALSVPLGGVYKLLSACDLTKALDVSDQRTDNGAPLQLYDDWGGQNQQFNLEDAGNGYVTLAPQHAGGMRVDVQYGGTASGTPIWQYQANHTDAQRWALTADGDFYQLSPALAPDQRLDLNGASAVNHGTIQLWQKSGTCAQRWKLQPVGEAGAGANIAAYNRALGRGINLSAMEAPWQVDWSVVDQSSTLQTMKDAGFQTVRLPVNWPVHAAPNAPYAIDPTFLTAVDRVVQQATSRGLHLIVDFHGYDDMQRDPAGQTARFLGLWRQVAEHYRNQSDLLSFELMNEPNGALDNQPALWNAILARAVSVIRESNPTRPLIVGPVGSNGAWALNTLALPSDPNLIVTVHDYTPFHFTHQGADWVDGSNAWIGTTWTGTDAEKQQITAELDGVASWAKANNRPMFVGEFGSYEKADLASRARWTSFMRSAFEARGFSWAYWEFDAGFGAYDPVAGQWRQPLLQALMP